MKGFFSRRRSEPLATTLPGHASVGTPRTSLPAGTRPLSLTFLLAARSQQTDLLDGSQRRQCYNRASYRDRGWEYTDIDTSSSHRTTCRQVLKEAQVGGMEGRCGWNPQPRKGSRSLWTSHANDDGGVSARWEMFRYEDGQAWHFSGAMLILSAASAATQVAKASEPNTSSG